MSKQIEKNNNWQIEESLPEVSLGIFAKLDLIGKSLPKTEQPLSKLEQAVENEFFIRKYLLSVVEPFFDKYPNEKLSIVEGKSGNFEEKKPTIKPVFISREEGERECRLIYDSERTAFGSQIIDEEFLRDLYIDYTNVDLAIPFISDASTVEAFGSLSKKQIIDRVRVSLLQNHDKNK